MPETPRHELVEGWNAEAIRKLRIAIVGTGAIGGASALACARLPVRTLELVDPDVIEEHNRYNQPWDRRDLGLPKVEALRTRIEALGTGVQVITHQAKIQDCLEKLKADIVLGCLDNVQARTILNGFAVDRKKVYVDAGIHRHSGSIVTYIPNKTPCLACHNLLPKAAPKAKCSTDPIPSTYIGANMASALQVMQVVSFAHGDPIHSYTYFDAKLRLLFQENFPPNPDCQRCGAIDENVDEELAAELAGWPV